MAQNPDLVFQVDGRMQFLSQKEGPTFVRFYDNLGRHSLASVRAYLEIGFQAFVSQKFARIPGDADTDQLDEYYIEDEGSWRVGKQYLPFGSGRFLRESVTAVRGDTQLILEGFPMSLAACDAGERRQRGFTGRIGSRLGLSFAVGRHFGINATSFDLVRRPEDSPGTGRGYREIYAIDYSKNAGGLVTIGGELLIARRGETSLDRPNTLFDLTATLAPRKGQQVVLGWTRDSSAHDDFYRIAGSFLVNRYLILEPMIRYRESEIFDIAMTLRFKF